MINNRQSGRRRGRGGGGGRPPGATSSPGNRQDNRQRGNAAQLLEKYKGMARDAQMQGDRVLTETYLQYADHYFRVLNESRVRYEEQRRQRDDYGDEDEDRDDQAAARDAAERADTRDEPREAPRHDSAERSQGNGELRARRARSRRPDSDSEVEGGDEGESERIALDALPPAIAASGGGDEDAPARAPRARRPRRPRGDDEDVAPAA